jgi:hypothetical protein
MRKSGRPCITVQQFVQTISQHVRGEWMAAMICTINLSRLKPFAGSMASLMICAPAAAAVCLQIRVDSVEICLRVVHF